MHVNSLGTSDTQRPKSIPIWNWDLEVHFSKMIMTELIYHRTKSDKDQGSIEVEFCLGKKKCILGQKNQKPQTSKILFLCLWNPKNLDNLNLKKLGLQSPVHVYASIWGWPRHVIVVLLIIYLFYYSFVIYRHLCIAYNAHRCGHCLTVYLLLLICTPAKPFKVSPTLTK